MPSLSERLRGLWRRPERYPVYRQLDEADCGPTCLRMVAKHYGRGIDLATLRERCYITRQGVSLLGIAEGAEDIGLRALGLRVAFDRLGEVPTPFVSHWDQNHFVVIYEVSAREVVLADPAAGMRRVSREEFRRGSAVAHTGVGVSGSGASGGSGGGAGSGAGVTVLALEPTPDFYAEDDDEEGSGFGWGYLSRYLIKYRPLLAQLALGMALGSLLSLVTPFLTQAVVDFGIQNQDLHFVTLILIAQLMVFFGQVSVEFIRRWILLHVGQRLNISIVADFLAKLMRLPMPFFDRRTVGDVLQRIQDHRRIESFLTATTFDILFSMLNLAVYGVILLIYSRFIFLVFAVGSVVSALWVLVFLRRRRRLDDRRFSELSDSQSNVVQLVTGMSEIKLNNVERPKRWEWEHIQARRFRTNVKSLGLSQAQEGGATAVQQLSTILIVYLAAKAVIDGDMTLGMMMAVQQIVGQMAAPVGSFLSFVQSYQDASLSLQRMGEVYAHENESEGRLVPARVGGSLRLDAVSFQYEGPRSPYVLRDLSLEIEEGRTTAVVGISGSGKTTLLRLLLGFYGPVAGEVRVGGLDLGRVDPRAWRRHCGVVMQDGFLFHDTILQNIVMDPENADVDRALEAAEVANIRGFVETLPLGFQTKIGRDGLGLSQGQKQRILIARAVYKDAPYLFFDEATSALDANNERQILERLDEYFEGRTVLVIAHRLSTVKNADRIVVLDRGRIVEVGTHDELVQQQGDYFRLVRNQLELGS